MGYWQAVSETKILNVNWVPAVGSALGAVTSAVVLSTLGVAGTLIGAALGSLVITVGGSIYSRSIERTKEHIGSRVGAKSRTGQGSDTAAGSSTPETHPGGLALGEQRSAAGGTKRSLPWKRILGLAGILFVVTMAVILAFELTTGRTVSSYTGGSSTTSGGTSIPGISSFRNSGTGTTPGEQQQQDQQQRQDQAPTDVPSLPGDQAPAPAQEVPAAPDAPQQQAPAPEQQQGGQEGGQQPAPAQGGQEPAPAQ